MKYNVTLGDLVYEVEVERTEAVLLSVTDAAVHRAQADIPQAAVQAAPQETAQAAVQTTGVPVKAPLPGVVLAIKVAPGDSVRTGDVLLVLEAMKMENEIVAPRDGKVAQILVAKGNSVANGATLLTLA